GPTASPPSAATADRPRPPRRPPGAAQEPLLCGPGFLPISRPTRPARRDRHAPPCPRSRKPPPRQISGLAQPPPRAGRGARAARPGGGVVLPRDVREARLPGPRFRFLLPRRLCGRLWRDAVHGGRTRAAGRLHVRPGLRLPLRPPELPGLLLGLPAVAG